MGNTLNALKKGLVAAVEAATGVSRYRYQAAGKVIRCPHCGGELFHEEETRHISLPAGYTGPTATLLICSSCERIEWWRSRPERL